MSGDVQPRKRKDKRRKHAAERKSEGEIIFSRHSSFQDDDESSHGVHITKMGSDDVHLHIHHEHETGGHWCAKVFFFVLLAILAGLVGLIILENRGLSDLDTPLSESRFSNYFDGWVEEHRADHEEHDVVQASIEEHDEHDEPFEEVEDHGDEEDENGDGHDDDDHEELEADDDEENKDDENADEDEDVDEDDDEEEEENITKEEVTTAESLQDNDDEEENEDEDDNQNYENDDDGDENLTKENTAAEVDDEDDDDDENNNINNDEDEEDEIRKKTAEDEDENDDEEEENITPIQNDDDEFEEDGNDNEDDDNDLDEEIIEARKSRNIHQQKASINKRQAENDPFDEEDDDGTFESLEKVVDNDAEELLLLQEKARKMASGNIKDSQKEDANDDDENLSDVAPSWASSLAVKIAVGCALAIVARLVLIRKNANSKIKPKGSIGGGPQSMNDIDSFEHELRKANEEMMRENFNNALQRLTMLSKKYPKKPDPYLVKAKCLDRFSEKERSNQLLKEAIGAYKDYLSFEIAIQNDTLYKQAAERCIDRMRFIGFYTAAVPVHYLLIKRFTNDPDIRNDLSITFLMANRLSEVKVNSQEVLKKWPKNGLAQIHFGYTIKQLHKDYKNAIVYLQKGLQSNDKGTQEGFFYFNLGESLQRLGRQEEALEVYQKGADMKLFPSAYQRSLYNVNGLKAQPFWLKKDTSYMPFFNNLERNWEAIRMEGINLLNKNGYFKDEAENLRDTGDWKQFELYARGQKKHMNCQRAPITCSLIEDFRAAKTCSRGQVKFSVIHPGTHVWPHCGPTNCRLRAHLGLIVPKKTFLRVANTTRTWKEGKFLIFDDSFEHEVWHNGTSPRLVLIVDVWHPELSQQQRQSLSPI